jgi:mono/diheme cytochrome c family protein
MPRVLKFVLRGLAALLAVVALLLVFVYWTSGAHLRRVFAVTAVAPTLPTDAAALARGRHLAQTRGCVVCHGADLGGAPVIYDVAMGRIYGPNVTRGRGGLPADFGDVDFERAIRHGIAPGGRGLFLMPSEDYARLTDEDMADLIAYVKAVPPVDRVSVPLRIGPVARALIVAGKIRLAAEKIDHAGLKADVVKRGPTVAYGRYVAAACTGCHGANFSGGRIAAGPPGWPPAANLTPHPSGHLAGWSETEFIATLRTGRRPDGTALDPAMPRSFGQMDDVELKAIAAFLRTLPAVPAGIR